MNIPEGYKLVPVEPTEEMLYMASWVHGPGGIGEVKRRIALEYCAALSVSPTPPQPIYDETKERELFEAQYLLTPKRWADGYADRCVNNRWKGWLACAQSSAKGGEVGHE